MTTYRTIVSWLAFFLLLWRGSSLTFVFLMDHFGWHRIAGPDEIFLFLGLSGPDLKETLVWGLLWGPISLMIVAPWLCAGYGRCRRLPFAAGLENDTALLLNVLGRWAFAFAWLASLLHWVPRGVEAFLSWNPTYREEPLQGYFTGIFVPWAISVLCAMLIAPEFSRMASSGFTAFIDAVFFPGGREKIPPYTLKLARFYVQKKRWDEAEAEYARMLSFYPEALEAWQERLDLAFQRKEAADPAPREVLAEAIKALRQPRDKEAIFQRFSRLPRAGLKE